MFFQSDSPKRAFFSYVFDYAIVIVLLAAFLALNLAEPFHQQFSLRNYTLQYTYAVKERVSNAALIVIAVVCPAVVIAFWTLVVDGIFSHHTIDGRRRKHTWSERLWELNCGLLGLALAISLQYVIVGSLKNLIGKPRPDLIDRCQPPTGSVDPPFGLSNHSICTQTDNAILKDGFLSFPSGHSSTSFSGLFYLSLYLAAKLHILDSRGEAWKMFVVLAPSLSAACVAGSRIIDARHHPFDVLFGSALGMVIAWASYRQYFPAVSDFKAKGRAYPMRTFGQQRAALQSEEQIELESAGTDPERTMNTSYTGIRP